MVIQLSEVLLDTTGETLQTHIQQQTQQLPMVWREVS